MPVRSYRVEERTHYVPVTTRVEVPYTSYQTYQRTYAVPHTVYRQVHRTCNCGEWVEGERRSSKDFGDAVFIRAVASAPGIRGLAEMQRIGAPKFETAFQADAARALERARPIAIA